MTDIRGCFGLLGNNVDALVICRVAFSCLMGVGMEVSLCV